MILLFAAWNHAAHAANGACPAYVEAEITVLPVQGDLRFDATVNAAGLAAVRGGGSPGQKEEVPAGLTWFNLQISENSQFRISVGDGSVCAQVAKIDVNVSVSDLTVYTAAEIPPGSCSYRAVLEHELKHVAVANIFLEEISPLTQKHIADFLRAQGVVTADSAAEAGERIKQSLDGYLGQLNESLMTVSDDMEKRVDTPEEYKRLGEVCDGELADIMRRGAGINLN